MHKFENYWLIVILLCLWPCRYWLWYAAQFKPDILAFGLVFFSIYLLKPYNNNYGLNKIAKRKNYAYHFAYKVNNLNKSIKKLKKNKFKILVNPVPAKAFKNKKISFLKMKNDFIIELIES